MTPQLVVVLAAIAAAAVIAWLCTRGYYRAAYGDRYERGYADGKAAQIRAYQDATVSLDAWRAVRGLHAAPPPQAASNGHSDGGDVHVLGSWYPLAAGPPRYAELSPEALDGGPPTSEWARDLIAGIEKWNAANLPARDLPWLG